MATLTVYTPSVSGATFTAVAATVGGDVVPNNGKTVLYVKNGGGGSITVTITPQNTTPSGFSLAPVAVVLATTVERMIGPFDPQYFNNSGGQIVITYSGVTSVTVLPISLS